MGVSLHQRGGFAAFTSVLLYTCGLWQMDRDRRSHVHGFLPASRGAASPPSGDSAPAIYGTCIEMGSSQVHGNFPASAGRLRRLHLGPAVHLWVVTDAQRWATSWAWTSPRIQWAPSQLSSGPAAHFGRCLETARLQREIVALPPGVAQRSFSPACSRSAGQDRRRIPTSQLTPAPCSRNGATAWPRRSRCCMSSPDPGECRGVGGRRWLLD